MANLNQEHDRLLSEDELSNAAGGVQGYDHIIAYCKACGKRLECTGSMRIEGGLTNLFVCRNENCKEYKKQKNNLEVNW